jgi:subtilisin-like proprotein convertase family protein
MRWLIIGTFVMALASISNAEQYIYWEFPDLHIPSEDSAGVLDTIFIDQDIQIEDLNVYVGIGTEAWGGLLGIPIWSPWQDTVYLIYYDGTRRYLNFWFDTDGVEDGPGELEQYYGHDARGIWVINPREPVGHFNNFIFHSWAIEVIGQPMGIDDDLRTPQEFGVYSTYPNPFNSSIIFKFALVEPGFTSLKIYNILGQEVATLLGYELPAAIHSVTWKAGDMPSGIYYYSLKSGDKLARGEITLAK